MVDIGQRVLRKLFQSHSRKKANFGCLVRCKSVDGRSKEFKRRVFPASMDRHGAIVKPKYPFAGATSCSGRSSTFSSARGHCQTASRQQDSLLLHKETRRNEESSVVSRGMSFMGRVLGERREPPGPPMAVLQGQRGGRLPVSKRSSSLGDRFRQICVSDDNGCFSSSSNIGCLCIQRNSSASKIHELVQGQRCCGNRCPSAQMGSSNLPIPSSSSVIESSSTDKISTHSCSFNLPSVAKCSVVANGGRDVTGTSNSSSILSEGSKDDVTQRETSIFGTSNCSSHFRSALGVTHSSSGLDKDDLDFLSNHLSEGTQSGYGYVFKRFQKFCQDIGQNPFTCDPVSIVKYIRSIYDSGAAYSTVNHHRSCISKFHSGFGPMSAGTHPLVSQALKAVFRLRPPLPKYVNTFDISLVFTYILSLPPNDQLSLKLLSYKTVFLLTSSTISRLSSLARLGPQLQVFEVR